jgi:hypothetical protein
MNLSSRRVGSPSLSRPLLLFRPRDWWDEFHAGERSEQLIGGEDESDPFLIHVVCDIDTKDSIAETLPAFDLQANACRRMESLAAQPFPLVPHNTRIEEERRA